MWDNSIRLDIVSDEEFDDVGVKRFPTDLL